MHVRYTADTFPEDIMLQVTDDRQNFQGRYVMRHPFKGKPTCDMASSYYKDLKNRFEKEAKNLASLTGWNINKIRQKMEKNGQSFNFEEEIKNEPWWENMWND